MKIRKARIHVKDQYCAGPQCDCGYKSATPDPKISHTPTPWKQDGNLVLSDHWQIVSEAA